MVVEDDHVGGPDAVLGVHKQGGVGGQLDDVAVPLHARHEAGFRHGTLQTQICFSLSSVSSCVARVAPSREALALLPQTAVLLNLKKTLARSPDPPPPGYARGKFDNDETDTHTYCK